MIHYNEHSHSDFSVSLLQHWKSFEQWMWSFNSCTLADFMEYKMQIAVVSGIVTKQHSSTFPSCWGNNMIVSCKFKIQVTTIQHFQRKENPKKSCYGVWRRELPIHQHWVPVNKVQPPGSYHSDFFQTLLEKWQLFSGKCIGWKLPHCILPAWQDTKTLRVRETAGIKLLSSTAHFCANRSNSRAL